jgi:hypothetical protein
MYVFMFSELTGEHVSDNSHRTLAWLLLAVATSAFISGCGVTLNPVKRKPLEILPLQTSLAPNSQAISVWFESTLPGTPLSETVWDNKSGAFADTGESTQIGYTQDLTKLLVPPFEAAPLQPSYTRIFIPFGRIFEGVFQSGLQKVFPNSPACAEGTNLMENSSAAGPGTVVRLRVVEFWVWENPLNHINLKATVECKVYQTGVTNQPEYLYEARQETTNQSIGSAMTTSSGFVKKMNEISNGFAAGLSEDILEHLQKKIGE